jgi:predicted metal-dependent HD superfamily phosphohydrolase
VRREYDWVPEPQWKLGRCGMLAQFLARPAICATGICERAMRQRRDAISPGSIRHDQPGIGYARAPLDLKTAASW